MLLCCHNFLLLCRVSDFLDRFRNGRLFGRKRLLDVVLWARAAAFLGELDGVRDAVNGSRSGDEVRQGIHVVACAKFLYGSLDFEMAEARALLEGILVAVEKGLFPLEVESDDLNVVNLCSVFWVIDGWFRVVSVVVELMMGVGNELMMVMN
ncbi:hypothetical protein LWI29_019909 [Acer saccharum]|uniref:RNase H type-1 domain-containing protein n=1 Tax=Acer saccharum TaxID=4024 RepID=A0AA39VKR6_ACESA|nr:hypothetical protein LWI29_019909 [Acer saccharum]